MINCVFQQFIFYRTTFVYYSIYVSTTFLTCSTFLKCVRFVTCVITFNIKDYMYMYLILTIDTDSDYLSLNSLSTNGQTLCPLVWLPHTPKSVEKLSARDTCMAFVYNQLPNLAISWSAKVKVSSKYVRNLELCWSLRDPQWGSVTTWRLA